MAINVEREIQSVKDSVGRITNGQKYVIKTDKIRRNLDATIPTAVDNANVLATLISDLKKQNILK